MRVAIVGATGLIGRRLTAALHARGDEVVAVVRNGDRVEGATTTVTWDATSAFPPSGLTGCEAVVNLAGAPIGRRWNAQIKQEILTSRIDLTRSLVAAIEDGGPHTLVNASAVGYYGNRSEEVDERAEPGSGFLAEVCTGWEREALAAQGHGARVVLLRTGVVLATDGGALPQMLGPTKLGVGGPIAGGRQWFPWIHIDDAVGLIVHALDTAAINGPINLVAPGIVQQGAFASALGRAVHRPAVVPTPAFAIRLMLGEGAQLVLDGQHVVPAVARETGYTFRFPDVDAALTDLLAAP